MADGFPVMDYITNKRVLERFIENQNMTDEQYYYLWWSVFDWMDADDIDRIIRHTLWYQPKAFPGMTYEDYATKWIPEAQDEVEEVGDYNGQ